MKNILLPTDFSENSWNAIVYALDFFTKKNCNFYLLHTTAIYKYYDGSSSIMIINSTIEKTLKNQAKTDLKKLRKKIKKLPVSTQHNFITIFSDEPLVSAIKSNVQEKNIDLIVMGTKGASGIKKAIIGSNTADLITKVKCPVLAIPEKATFHKLNEIAFPTDYNIFYQTKILNTLLELMKTCDASLRILHVRKKDEKLTTYQEGNKEYLHSFFMDEKHSFHRVTNKKIEAGVQCFVESRAIDMIVMVAKNLNLFQQILFKPTVEEISYHTEVPFLVLHE